jgi:hypothetical protein
MASTANNMGIGMLASAAFKRKYRWTFEVMQVGGPDAGSFNIGGAYVKSGNRPQIDIDETEINFLNGKTFIPGKATFNEISFTYYDVAVKDDPTVNNLLRWINRVYNFEQKAAGREIKATQGSYPDKGSGYAGTGMLTLLDGCGFALEKWKLINCWPKSINFGDLDYSSSDECNIEVSLRYAFATYENFCNTGVKDPDCTGICGSRPGTY